MLDSTKSEKYSRERGKFHFLVSYRAGLIMIKPSWI